MTRITDDITFTALRGFNKRPGYSQLERMRDALEAVLPHLEGDTPATDWVDVEDAIRDEFARFGASEVADDARRATEAVRALIGGAK
jgi:hypothetical protein